MDGWPLDELLKARYGDKWERRLYGTAKLIVEIPTVLDGKSGVTRLPLNVEPIRIPIIARHNGSNVDGYHRHRRTAKYLFSRQPDVDPHTWSHIHAEAYTPAAYGGRPSRADYAVEQHMRSTRHSDHQALRFGKFIITRDPDVDWWVTEHEHSTPQQGTQPLAQRLTITPKARELLAQIEGTGDGEVFIAAESCLKEAAILTAIVETERRATVVSYPSVTLYPDELDTYAADHFRGLRVWIVPDNDWATNQQVRTQMFIARERLRKVLGNTAVHIAAPPIADEKIGVDDWLGKKGGSLDDLVVLDRNLGDLDDYRDWKYNGGRKRGSDKAQTAVLTWMALLSDENGTSMVTNQSIARLAWPTAWAEAAAEDAAAGHDQKKNRETDTARTKVRMRASRAAVDMSRARITKPALVVIREDIVLDDDGIPVSPFKMSAPRVRAGGIPLKVKERRIVPDLWERLKGRQYTIGDAS
jgi:hypothetical protein